MQSAALPSSKHDTSNPTVPQGTLQPSSPTNGKRFASNNSAAKHPNLALLPYIAAANLLSGFHNIFWQRCFATVFSGRGIGAASSMLHRTRRLFIKIRGHLCAPTCISNKEPAMTLRNGLQHPAACECARAGLLNLSMWDTWKTRVQHTDFIAVWENMVNNVSQCKKGLHCFSKQGGKWSLMSALKKFCIQCKRGKSNSYL